MSKQFSQLLCALITISAAAIVIIIPLGSEPASAAENPEPQISPLAYSQSAAAVGRSHYLINCQQCHDADGRALANIDYIAADLTAPDTWYYGTSPLNIFYSIKNGAGLEMPPFNDSLSDEVIWQIVAHVLNIGPEVSRPTDP